MDHSKPGKSLRVEPSKKPSEVSVPFVSPKVKAAVFVPYAFWHQPKAAPAKSSFTFRKKNASAAVIDTHRYHTSSKLRGLTHNIIVETYSYHHEIISGIALLLLFFLSLLLCIVKRKQPEQLRSDLDSPLLTGEDLEAW